MFKGFKLSKLGFGNDFDKFHGIGLDLYHSYEKDVHDSLSSFFLDSKKLDGTKIIDSWFPKVDSHIFLSHSHNDKDEVIALAGWLKYKFNLDSFIDSCIWGYGNDLIQVLDNNYSWLDEKNRIYDYKKVLFSTSHVHMMLSTALSSMIDKTECLIFYDTENSVQKFESVLKTGSPWIYSEIAFAEVVRKKRPERIKYILETRKFSSGGKIDHLEKALEIAYELDFGHLKSIDADTLNEWESFCKLYKKEEALDKLYEITFPITKIKD